MAECACEGLRFVEEEKRTTGKLEKQISSLMNNIAEELSPFFGERLEVVRQEGGPAWYILPQQFLRRHIKFLGIELPVTKTICGLEEYVGQKSNGEKYIRILILDPKAEGIIKKHVNNYAQANGIQEVNFFRKQYSEEQFLIDNCP